MTRKSSETHEAIHRWEVQVRKGILEFVILLSLREREHYGFELISGIARRASIDLPEGTIYPLLLRLATSVERLLERPTYEAAFCR